MNARAYARFELNFFNKIFNTKVVFKAVPKKKNKHVICCRWSVRIGKNCTLGLEYVLKTSGTVFPNTDRPTTANNIYVFYNNYRNSRALIGLFSSSISGPTHEFVTQRAREDNLPICCGKKQIDGSFSCVCPVIDNEFRHNCIVKVAVDPSFQVRRESFFRLT